MTVPAVAQHTERQPQAAPESFMSSLPTVIPSSRKQSSTLMYVLGFAFALFIGILIFAYAVTKNTHPVFVDEHGNPVNAESTDVHSHGGNGSK